MAHELEQWWIAVLGNTAVWARLRVYDTGVAHVLDCDGRTVPYDSEDSARSALLDAEFRALDGLDEDDAAQLGLVLGDLEPPEGENDADLRDRMIQALPGSDLRN